MKVKGVSLTGLSKRQVAAMRRHARHHTAKHLRSMVAAMRKEQPLVNHIQVL